MAPDRAENAWASCFRSGEGLCKALTGNVELENLIPPGIYEASLASQAPIELSDYLKSTLDGALDVLKKQGADSVNDLVSRRVVAKAGIAGSIALATITAAAKQIHMAIETGTNDWGSCLNTDKAGTYVHQLVAGGIPESHALVRPMTVNGVEQIECCYSELHLFQDDGIWSDTQLRVDDYLAPIENGPFGQSLCHQQEGTIRETQFSKSAGFKVYFRFENSQKVTVTGNACVLGAGKTRAPVRVLKQERPSTLGYEFTMHQSRTSNTKVLYPPGERPADRLLGRGRYDSFFELPNSLAPAPYSWPKGGAPIAARKNTIDNQALRLRDRNLRPARPVIGTNMMAVATPAMPNLPLNTAKPIPSLPKSSSPVANALIAETTLPPISPAPFELEAEPRPAPAPPPRSSVIVALPDPDLRKASTHRPKPSGPPAAAALRSPNVPLAEAKLARRSAVTHKLEDRPDLHKDFGPAAPARPVEDPPSEIVKSRSVHAAAAREKPRVTPVKPAPAVCGCANEWSAWRENIARQKERWSICVLRKGGRAIVWAPSYLSDPGCAQTCNLLRSHGVKYGCVY